MISASTRKGGFDAFGSRSIMWTTLFVIFSVMMLMVGEVGAEETQSSYLRSDPDTTCSEAYRQTPTKEACLATNDRYGRPCSFCQDGTSLLCYNADEARWAKWFGAKCETSPSMSDSYMEEDDEATTTTTTTGSEESTAM